MKIFLKGNGHVFQEIVAQYKRYIEAGVLREQEKLPSCRELALEIGVNPNTVEKAYSVLAEQGLVTIIPKKGAFVSKRDVHPLDDAVTQISLLKQIGFKRVELIEAIDVVYGEETV